MHTVVQACRDRLQRLGALWICNVAIFVFAVWVFGAIAEEVNEKEHLDLENRLMHALRAGDPSLPVGPPWLADVARDVTGLGSVAVLATVVLLVAGFLAFTRRYAASAFVTLASIGGATLNHALKTAFGRDRPDAVLHLIDIHSHSFPSGHAMSSATIYLALAVLLSRLAERRREKVYIVAAALFLSFVVGLSRIYLGVHYPSDVIAGWAAGVAWAQLCWFVVRAISRRRLRRAASSAVTTDEGSDSLAR